MNETGLRVLVVDDERAIRRFLRTSLAANGYVVFEATNGAEALEAVVRDRPDVMILDLGLPDMDGIQVTARLREWSPMPIIVLSVRDQEADKIAALGGEPTTTPRPVPPAATPRDMLKAILDAELEAGRNYAERVRQAEEFGDKGLTVQLENMVLDETGHAEETAKLLKNWE